MLLCCYDMPYRVMHSHGPGFKEYGICNGSKGRLKASDLSDKDQAMLQNSSDRIVMLSDLPKMVFLRMETTMKNITLDFPTSGFRCGQHP